MEGWSKKEKGLMDTDNSVVIARWRGIKRLNGNGKNTIKIKLKNKRGCGKKLYKTHDLGRTEIHDVCVHCCSLLNIFVPLLKNFTTS